MKPEVVDPQEVEGIGCVGPPGSGHGEERLTEGEEKRGSSSFAWGKYTWPT